MDTRQQPIVVQMGVRNHNAQEVWIQSAHQTSNIRKHVLIASTATEGLTEVEQQRLSIGLKLNTAAADLS